MSHVEPSTQVVSERKVPRLRNGALWILQGVTAAVLLSAGIFKLMGAEEAVAAFEEIGFGQWLRYLTGVLEVVGAVLLLVPSFAWIGALVLATVMLGAVFTHLVLIGGSPASALVFLFVTTIIALGRVRRGAG